MTDTTNAITDAIEALEHMNTMAAEHTLSSAMSSKSLTKLKALRDAVPYLLGEAMETQRGGPEAVEAFFTRHELAGGPNHVILMAARLLNNAVGGK